jgi:hypothetical protein
MTGRRTIGAPLALAALLLWAAPALAAQPSPSAPELFAGAARMNDQLALMGQGSSTLGLPDTSALSELRFENRDGYTIAVVGFGQTVALSVTRARLHAGRGPDGEKRKLRDRVSSTTYLAHGEVTPTSIAASFGDRGRIAVRFRPSGRAVRATRDASCKKADNGIIAQLGVFAGELRFEGEGGYTSAEVHRVRGRSVDLAALLACLSGPGPGRHAVLPPPKSPLGVRLPGLVAARDAAPRTPGVPTHPSAGPRSTTLVADSKSPLGRTVFVAHLRGRDRTRFVAVTELSEGSLGVVRLAYVRGAPSAFSSDDILSHATATPPPPFSGTGTLQHGPGNAKSWSGSLAVSFLGAPRVPLIGSAFGAWLTRGF